MAEHKNRHLVETTRTLLLQHIVPQHFWGNAILTASYLINHMPSSILGDQVPHSLIFPNQHLFCLPPRVFGCTCFVYILTPGQDILSTRPRSASSLVILAFNEIINVILLIHIDTSFLLMSPFFNILLYSLPRLFPFPRSYLYLSSFPFRLYHLSPQLFNLDRYRFILITRVSTSGL